MCSNLLMLLVRLHTFPLLHTNNGDQLRCVTRPSLIESAFLDKTNDGWKIGRCAVVAQSNFIKSVVKIENKVFHLVNRAFEERYFDTEELEEGLTFISTGSDMNQ